MKRFLLYGHGGAFNHGAEAIIQCTVKLIKKYAPKSEIILSTHFKEQDMMFNLPVDSYCERKTSISIKQNDAHAYQSTIDLIDENTICLSVGGDNYCYDNWSRWNAIHNAAIRCGAPDILWSCSVEPSMITPELLNVLRTFYQITARESLTYNALLEHGLKNVIDCSDIAFLLETQPVMLPNNFDIKNTVAINVSPLITRREFTNGIVVQNILNVIQYILDKTNMHVMLIPHVLMPMDNDLELLRNIYEQFDRKEKICLIDSNFNAAQYKFLISKCRFGIFARTHASIASYASIVPTIVLGYSVKSRGIAADIGMQDFILPIESMKENNDLVKLFQLMIENESYIKSQLLKFIPFYKSKADTLPKIGII